MFLTYEHCPNWLRQYLGRHILALRQAEVSPLPPLEYILSAAPRLRTVNTQNNGLLSFCANGSSVLAGAFTDVDRQLACIVSPSKHTWKLFKSFD